MLQGEKKPLILKDLMIDKVIIIDQETGSRYVMIVLDTYVVIRRKPESSTKTKLYSVHFIKKFTEREDKYTEKDFWNFYQECIFRLEELRDNWKLAGHLGGNYGRVIGENELNESFYNVNIKENE